MATRLGVDVGGTFTDLIFYDDATGEIRVRREIDVHSFEVEAEAIAQVPGSPQRVDYNQAGPFATLALDGPTRQVAFGYDRRKAMEPLAQAMAAHTDLPLVRS